MARESPDLSKAVALLEEGECSRAIGFLSVYTGQEAKPVVVDYLLAQAHLCTGDFLKAAHHTRKAWDEGEGNRKEVAGLAQEILAALSKEGRNRTTAEFGQAVWLLTRLDMPLHGDPVLVQLLKAYSERLASRGELQGAGQGIDAMKRLGATLEQTLIIETLTASRLGNIDALKARVTESRDQLGFQGRGPALQGSAPRPKRRTVPTWLRGFLPRQNRLVVPWPPCLWTWLARSCNRGTLPVPRSPSTST